VIHLASDLLALGLYVRLTKPSGIFSGSYLCECLKGYTGNGDVACVDVNECVTSPCDSNAQCSNVIGSYECQCHSGFAGNGFKCNDVDECGSGADSKCQVSGDV